MHGISFHACRIARDKLSFNNRPWNIATHKQHRADRLRTIKVLDEGVAVESAQSVSSLSIILDRALIAELNRILTFFSQPSYNTYLTSSYSVAN
jgi:hypothetical protein